MKKSYLAVAKEAALNAGNLLIQSYGKLKKSQVHMKAKNDFVTELDKKSEALVISHIKKYFPDHSFYAEESGAALGSKAVWIIDPLDGTSNYIHQIPLFAVSIGVYENKALRAAVIYDPVHRELFLAEKGKGAFLNKARIRVSPTSKLKNCVVATGIPFRARDRFNEYMASLRKISLASTGLRRGGSAALDLAYVACGRYDLFWEIDLAPWDIAAGALLLQEAGGKITDMWGNAGFFKSCDIVASNSKTHNEILSITKKAFKPLKQDKRWILD